MEERSKRACEIGPMWTGIGLSFALQLLRSNSYKKQLPHGLGAANMCATQHCQASTSSSHSSAWLWQQLVNAFSYPRLARLRGPSISSYHCWSFHSLPKVSNMPHLLCQRMALHPEQCHQPCQGLHYGSVSAAHQRLLNRISHTRTSIQRYNRLAGTDSRDRVQSPIPLSIICLEKIWRKKGASPKAFSISRLEDWSGTASLE